MDRTVRLSLGVAAVATLVLVPLTLTGGATAAEPNCRIEAHPPFLYAGMVFAQGRVVCATPANKISITVVLERDGVEVARVTRNDCRKTTVCWNTTARATDDPGDQTWCSHARGSATGAFLGEARACEAAEF